MMDWRLVPFYADWDWPLTSLICSNPHTRPTSDTQFSVVQGEEQRQNDPEQPH